MRRQSKDQIEKHNQMLNVHQFKAMHKFIKSFLTFEIQFFHDLMLNAI